jgi:pyruvate formate lyase activating enzyme
MADTESLVAKNPFELRIDQAARISEGDVRAALASGDMGFLHSYTTGSAVDGPGVRVVAWTSGCMWRCRYCHNPDTWKVGNGLPVSVARAVEVLKKYAHGLSVMAGGFTLSGGEPLMQHRFATKLLAAAKNMRIHTVIETNGYVGDRLTDADLANIDLVMLGIKSWGEDRHKDLTGVDLAPTLDFARRLAALGKPMWIRFVFVPGLTDDPAIAGGIAEFAADLGNVQRVDVLPFHQMGRYKWQALGLQYSLDDVAPPTQEALEGAVGIFRSQGLTAH